MLVFGPGKYRERFPEAILDQGLFAGSNFLLNVLLARWIAPADYGAFALAYSVFLLLGVFHSALPTGPMLVFGPGKYRERFPEYIGILLRGHFALMLPGGRASFRRAGGCRAVHPPPLASAAGILRPA